MALIYSANHLNVRLGHCSQLVVLLHQSTTCVADAAELLPWPSIYKLPS